MLPGGSIVTNGTSRRSVRPSSVAGGAAACAAALSTSSANASGIWSSERSAPKSASSGLGSGAGAVSRGRGVVVGAPASAMAGDATRATNIGVVLWVCKRPPSPR